MNTSDQKDRQRILVTGAGGNVARHLCPVLKEQHEIFPTDLAAIPASGTRSLDILDQDALEEAARGMDAILHCAIAKYDDVRFTQQRTEKLMRQYHDAVMEVNIKGTFNIYEAARLARVPHVIYISSLTVVLGRGSSSHSPEAVPCPRDFYAVSKLFGEQLGELYSREYGIRTTALRLGQPFPIGRPEEAQWLKEESSRRILVPHDIIANAVLEALATEGSSLFQIKHVAGGVKEENGSQLQEPVPRTSESSLIEN